MILIQAYVIPNLKSVRLSSGNALVNDGVLLMCQDNFKRIQKRAELGDV
jgi:hypothetical protein